MILLRYFPGDKVMIQFKKMILSSYSHASQLTLLNILVRMAFLKDNPILIQTLRKQKIGGIHLIKPLDEDL